VNDSFFSYPKEVPEGVEYVTSIDFDGIILDVGSDNSVLGVEILDISKKLNVPKSNIQHPANMKIEIDVSKETIEVKLSFALIMRNKPITRTALASGANDLNLAVASQVRAVTA